MAPELGREHGNDDNGDGELMAALAAGDADEIIAAVNKWKGRTGGRPDSRGGGGRFQKLEQAPRREAAPR